MNTQEYPLLFSSYVKKQHFHKLWCQIPSKRSQDETIHWRKKNKKTQFCSTGYIFMFLEYLEIWTVLN